MKPIKGSYLSNLYIILTYWPQPAFILLVKICKNPVLELTSYRKPDLGPAQLTKIEPKSGSEFEPKSSRKVDQDSSKKSSRKVNQDRIEPEIEPKSGETRWTKRNLVRNIYIQFAY